MCFVLAQRNHLKLLYFFCKNFSCLAGAVSKILTVDNEFAFRKATSINMIVDVTIKIITIKNLIFVDCMITKSYLFHYIEITKA